MTYQASTRGAFAAGPEVWWRLPKIQKLAKMRGFRIPPPTGVAPEAAPAVAYINHDAWIAECPDPGCLGGHEDVWLDNLLFFCMRCGNRANGSVWIPVKAPSPEEVAAIEAYLLQFPDTAMRNWRPAPEEVAS